MDSASEKGYDAGKKVSGIKRHIAVDTQGLPHAIAVTTADVTAIAWGHCLPWAAARLIYKLFKAAWPIVGINVDAHRHKRDRRTGVGCNK